MWLAESQRQKWPTDRMFRFYETTYRSADVYLRDDTRAMAGRLGLPESRVKLLNTIVNSKVLFAAAKTWVRRPCLKQAGRKRSHISRVADVIYHDRWDVAVKATGLYKKDDATLEAVRALAVAKAKEYVSLKLPPGVSLERTAPELRKAEVYPDDVVVAWLTGPGTIAERVLPTTVKGSQAAEATNVTGGPSSVAAPADLASVVAEYRNVDWQGCHVEDLNSLIARLTEATNALDGMLSAARAQRRGRVG